MKERLTPLKNIRDKRVTVMNNSSEINWDRRHKITIHRFFLNTDDLVKCVKGSGRTASFQTLGFKM